MELLLLSVKQAFFLNNKLKNHLTFNLILQSTMFCQDFLRFREFCLYFCFNDNFLFSIVFTIINYFGEDIKLFQFFSLR